MDLKNLIWIIIVIGVVLLNIKIITELFKKNKENKTKRDEINFKVHEAFKTHESNLADLQQKYIALNSNFISYRNKVEATISEMENYIEKIIKISNEIIAFDDDFEEKLYTWCDLLSNPDDTEFLKKQIKEHLDRDVKLKEDIKSELEQQKIQRQQNIRNSFESYINWDINYE